MGDPVQGVEVGLKDPIVGVDEVAGCLYKGLLHKPGKACGGKKFGKGDNGNFMEMNPWGRRLP